MKRTVALGLILAALRALPAGAAELELGVSGGVAYDDNVFSSPTDPQSDQIVTIGPRIRLLDETGSLLWELDYRPVYEKYVDLKEADNWDHDLDLSVLWALSPRTTLRLTERYLDASNVSAAFIGESGPDPLGEPVLQLGSSRVSLSQFQALLQHLPTNRQEFTVSFARYDTDYEGGSTTEVMNLGGSFRYTLTPVDRLGLALSGTQQDVGIGGPIRYYNGSLEWIHRFDPTLTLNASAGPAWVDRPAQDFPEVLQERPRYPGVRVPLGRLPFQASTCARAVGDLRVLDRSCQALPILFPGTLLEEVVDLPRVGEEPSSDPTITYFAAIDLVKRWRDLSLTLSYTRDASTTSQVGGLVSDTFSLYVSWTPPARPWRLTFWGSYGQREFPGDGVGLEELVQSSTVLGVSDVAESVGFRFVEVQRSQTVDIYLAGLYAAYEVAPRTQLYFSATWEREDYNVEFGRAADRWDRLRITAGVIYTLPRINLPI